MPSRQALELLQVRQMRSPGQLLRNSSRHLRHLRSLASYLRSGSGFEFFSELLIARIYSSSFIKMRHFCCTAKGLFFRPIYLGRGVLPPTTRQFGARASPRFAAPMRPERPPKTSCATGLPGRRTRPRAACRSGRSGRSDCRPRFCPRSCPRCQFEIKKKLATLSMIAKTRKIGAKLNIQELSDRELNR